MGSAKSSAAMLIKNNAATQLVSLLHRPAHSAILRQCYCWLLENCLQCPTRQFSNRRQRKKQKKTVIGQCPVKPVTFPSQFFVFRHCGNSRKKNTKNERKVQRIRNPVPKKK